MYSLACLQIHTGRCCCMYLHTSCLYLGHNLLCSLVQYQGNAVRLLFLTITSYLLMLPQGRTTLLVGPPGAGKSVLLQLLAGHFKNTAFCRITGDIKYNGRDKKEFVIQRTAGLVDQYDEHIANLTVHETLDFATACQVDKKKGEGDHTLKVCVLLVCLFPCL